MTILSKMKLQSFDFKAHSYCCMPVLSSMLQTKLSLAVFMKPACSTSHNAPPFTATLSTPIYPCLLMVLYRDSLYMYAVSLSGSCLLGLLSCPVILSFMVFKICMIIIAVIIVAFITLLLVFLVMWLPAGGSALIGPSPLASCAEASVWPCNHVLCSLLSCLLSISRSA